jgi:hypothetical protein
MNKLGKAKELSAKAKKLKKGKTKKVNKNGVNEICDNIKIEIKANSNKCKIFYTKHIVDDNDNVIHSIVVDDIIWLTDTPELGEVELDDDLNEKPNTYKKLKDEDLSLTNLKTQIDEVITKAIEMVEEKEGYNNIS